MRDFDMRQNFHNMRRQRANAIVHLVLGIVREQRDRHGDDWERYAARELFEQITTEGMEIVTDACRAAAGLSPRGPLGWTAEELAVLEATRLDALLRPIMCLVPLSNEGERETKATK